MAFTSESDLGGTATTDQDAFNEESWYSDNLDGYTSSGVPAQSGFNINGLLNYFGAPQTQAYTAPPPETVNPEYAGIGTIQYMQKAGFNPNLINAAGKSISDSRAEKARESRFNTIGTEVPGINYSIPMSPFDYSKPPAGQNPNFETQVNPYVPTDAIKGSFNSYVNPTGQQIAAMNAQAAAGQQVAHKGVSPNSFHYGVDKALGVEGTLPPDASKDNAFKKAVDSGVGKVADFAGDVGKLGLGALWKGGEAVWDGLTTEQANQADPVEESVGNTLPTTPVSEAFDDINKARYSAFKRAGSLGNTGPVGNDGTSFSPGRWDSYEKADQVQSSMNDGLMNSLTQAFNAKPNMVNARQVAHSGQMATDALTYEDRQAMTDKQIVELINNRGTTSTIHAKSYEEYDRDSLVPSSYKPIYSPKDENLINLFRMKGFDAEDFRVYPQQQQNIKGGGQTSLGLPGSFKDEPLLSVTPGIDLMGAGIVGLGSALAKFGTKSVGEFVSKFGKDSFDMLKGMLSKSNETNLSKLANSPINRSDDILTVTEQGLMKPAVRNKVGLGTNTPKEVGTINRNAPIQGENIYTNSQILGNRNRLNAKSIPVRARDANRRGRK